MPQVHSVHDAACGELHCIAEETCKGMYTLLAFEFTTKPLIQGYDISFLITNTHTDTMLKHKIVDFIIQLRTDFRFVFVLLTVLSQIHGGGR